MEADEESDSPINYWLKSLTINSFNPSLSRKSSGIYGTITDPFQVILTRIKFYFFKELPRPKIHSNSHLKNDSALELTDMIDFIKQSKRTPEKLKNFIEEKQISLMDSQQKRIVAWRQFVADLQFIEKVGNVSANFYREIRHLDSTFSREVHKVAIIYVGKDQEVH